MATSTLYCPQCGQIDSVRKVSTIVSAGISTGAYSGYGDGIGYSITGSSQTQLSRLLTPPIAPRENYFGGILFILIVSGIMGVFITCVGFVNIFSSQFEFGVFLLLFGLLCLGIAIGTSNSYTKLNKSEQIRFKKELHAWKKAIHRWQQLYYCHRCDGLYFPGLNYIVPIQYMMDFLYYEKWARPV
jgi:hypothetical protein